MVDISLSSKKKKSREEKYQPRHQKPSLPAVTARAAAARRRSWGRAMIAQARASKPAQARLMQNRGWTRALSGQRSTMPEGSAARILYCPLLEMLTAGGVEKPFREWKPDWRQPSTLGSQEIAPWFAPHVRLLPLTTFHILKAKI